MLSASPVLLGWQRRANFRFCVSIVRGGQKMRLWARSGATLLLVALAGYILDRLLRYEGMPGRSLLILSDLLVGLVAATLVFIIGKYHEQQDKLVSARLKVIADMNHHIRNALQVIALQTHFVKNEQEIGAMQQAVRRITWALREVLPQLPDSEHIPDFQNESTEMRKAAAAQGEESGTALH
jgi:HAMP domain-containing protein